MANEYLKRTPTSTGNRRVFTWSGWVKLNTNSGAVLFAASPTKDNLNILRVLSGGQIEFFDRQGSDASTEQVRYTPLLRDYGSWTHILINADTTQIDAANRVRAFVNGVELSRDAANTLLNNSASVDTPPRNQESWRLNGSGYAHYIGAFLDTSLITNDKTQYSDVFFVDGQALTPDVFGFYKQGKGYISAGSTQATDFRPGQWVPKTPRVIKTEINRRGGFGVNGFYLPMNDSNNFGADFHGEPNSIITLNEKLPQPRVGVATTASVGLGYTDALRADPYAANLVLALPFVSGGLSSGFGDYAPSIKGSGSAKSITVNGNTSIASTACYYGNAAFFDGNGDYLTIPSSSDFSFGTGDFTVEFWMKRLDSGTNVGLLDTRTTNTDGNGWFIRFSAATTIQLVDNTTQYASLTHSSDWNHIAFVRKSSVLTGYINGVAAGITTNATKNFTSSNFLMGGFVDVQSSPNAYAGYIQDLRVYKGVAKYKGGFDVPKPYTPVGIATWRAVPDSTANNFATWNPITPSFGGSNPSFSNGNLTVSDATSNGGQGSATIGVSTGKWYYEAIPTITSSGSNLIGIRPAEWFTYNYQNRTAWRDNGLVFNDSGTTVQSGTTYTTGDVIGIAIDMNTRKLWFSKNGSWVYSGDPDAGTSEAVAFASTYTHYTPFFAFDNAAGTEIWNANFGQNPTFSGNTTAGTYTDGNGKGLFKYEPPSGFLALCEDNLPTPAISDPGKHFKTVLYTGDGNSGRSITGIGFTPDLVWTKERNIAFDHAIYDSVRGAARYLSPNGTAAEVVDTTSLLSFNADGFTLGNWAGENVSGTNYVAWCWKAGAGTTSTNTDGSIPSVVSVNQDAGFSIVSYTGNGTVGATVGHGLGKKPKFFMTKNRDTAGLDWPVFSEELLGSNGYIYLNKTNAAATIVNVSAPTSSVLTLSGYNDNNKSGDKFIAYCWAEIEGFSKAFSYVGNGSADGPMVYLGLKPALIIIKRTNDVGNWQVYDSSRMSTNPNNGVLFPNLSNVEGTGSAYDIDFLSNGFKLRSTDTDRNASGSTYIGFAWAESPFTTSNSK